MQLNGDLLFYWISRKYPASKHIFGAHLARPCQVSRPMFWGTPDAMHGHFVVLGPDIKRQIVHQQRDAVFLCIGDYGEKLEAGKNEYIVVPSSVSTEQVFNYVLEIFDMFEKWEEQLSQSVNTFLSYNAIIRSCDQLVQDPLGLTDSQFRYVSYSKRLAHETGFEEKYGTTVLPLDTINILTSLPNYKQMDEIPDVYNYVGVENMLHKNIFYNGRYIGKLSILNKTDPAQNAYYSQILLILSEYIERLYAKLGTFWHRKSSDTKIKMMLCNLICGTATDTKFLYEKAGRLGHKSGDQYRLVQLKSHFSANHDKLNSVLATHIEDMWPGCLGLVLDEQFYILVNLSEFLRRTDTPFKEKLALFLRESLLVAGLSRSFTDLSRLQTASKQTLVALEMGEQADPSYWYFNFDDYAFQYLLHKGCQGFRPEQVIAAEILQLLEYDRQNDTDLNHTLKTYFQHSYNAVATAKELFIARSTLLNRLDRIEKLTGLDLKSYEKRVYLELSYMLMEEFLVKKPS